MQKITSNPM